jgi:hypothetical protein
MKIRICGEDGIRTDLIGEIRPDGCKVYFVDHDAVRLQIVEFSLGGHHYVYPEIPEDEIWVEDTGDRQDNSDNVTHEIVERIMMKYVDREMSYDEAHDVASSIEELLRKIEHFGEPLAEKVSSIREMLMGGGPCQKESKSRS